MPATPCYHMSVQDIMRELNCKRDRAYDIMVKELPHWDIAMVGSKNRHWRCRRKDFERWLSGRMYPADNDRLTAFAEKYMR